MQAQEKTTLRDLLLEHRDSSNRVFMSASDTKTLIYLDTIENVRRGSDFHTVCAIVGSRSKRAIEYSLRGIYDTNLSKMV